MDNVSRVDPITGMSTIVDMSRLTVYPGPHVCDRGHAAGVSPAPTSADPARVLGDAIRRRRGELGMDQRSLALVSGVSRTTVVAAEAGKPTLRLDVLLRICAALGLHLRLESDPR